MLSHIYISITRIYYSQLNEEEINETELLRVIMVVDFFQRRIKYNNIKT